MISNFRWSAEGNLFQRFAVWIQSEEADWFRVSTVAFLVAKVILIIATILAVMELGNRGVSEDLLTTWHQFDSILYVDIAENGYLFVLGGTAEQNTVAFFPLYPLLISIFKPVFGSAQVAGMLLSSLAFFPALAAVYHLAYLEFKDRAVARRTVAFLVAFPTAFFYSLTMTESLFLLLLTLGIYFARRRMWVYAVIAGALVSVTRPHGIFVMGFIGLEWLSAQGWKLSAIHRLENWKRLPAVFARKNLGSFFLLFLMPIGVLLYMLYLAREFNDPLAFANAQWAWKTEDYYGIGGIFYHYLTTVKFWFNRALEGTITGEDIYYFFRASINIWSVPLAWVIAFFTWRKLGLHYVLLTLLLSTLGLMHTSFSLLRYVGVVVPLFMTLGYTIRNERLYRGILLVTAGLQIFLAWRHLLGIST